MKRTYGKKLVKEANAALKKELKKREQEVLTIMSLKQNKIVKHFIIK